MTKQEKVKNYQRVIADAEHKLKNNFLGEKQKNLEIYQTWLKKEIDFHKKRLEALLTK